MAMGYGDLTPTPNTLSLFEKFNLQASGGRDETDYDCLVPTAVVPKFGSGSNYGIWFDRDGVDPWQDDDPTTPPPGGSAVPWGSHNGQTYNTGGFYDVEIHYHAINAGLGTMFATVNGIPTGFYIVPPGYDNMQPDYYPAGLSFKGNMSRMQLFAGIWAPDATYGHVDILDLTVTGELGVSDPLVVGFTYTPPSVAVGYTIHFTDTTHGGSTPYASRAWDFNGDAITDSTLQNPTWTFLTAGDYNVKLTVTDNIGDGCCVRSLTEKITVTDFPVGGEWTPTALQTVGLQSIVQWIAVAALAAAITTAVGLRMRRKVP